MATSGRGGTGKFVTFEAGTVIYTEGDSSTDMYIVQKGEVEILRQVGGELRREAVLKKGDFFGETSLLEKLPREATARALSDVELVRIERSVFSQIIRQNPDVAFRLLRSLSRRLRAALHQRMEVQPGPVAAKMDPVERKKAPPAPVLQNAPKQAPGPPRIFEPKSGKAFYVSPGKEHLIGRPDSSTGVTPEIDLSGLETKRTISRRHAIIYQKDGAVFLKELPGVANGTYVNGNRISPGTDVQLNDGDTIRFGSLKTIFYDGR